jgi:hypothetical protein
LFYLLATHHHLLQVYGACSMVYCRPAFTL